MMSTAIRTIEVFKTDICCETRANEIRCILLRYFPMLNITFDLEDEDKIMRITDLNVSPDKILEVLSNEGVQCDILE